MGGPIPNVILWLECVPQLEHINAHIHYVDPIHFSLCVWDSFVEHFLYYKISIWNRLFLKISFFLDSMLFMCFPLLSLLPLSTMLTGHLFSFDSLGLAESPTVIFDNNVSILLVTVRQTYKGPKVPWLKSCFPPPFLGISVYLIISEFLLSWQISAMSPISFSKQNYKL